MLFPDPSREVAEVIYSLKYRALRICNILLNCDRIFDAQWTYFQDDCFSFSRINEYKNLSPSFCPPNTTSLSVEFNCDVGDHIWNLPEEELFSRVATELDQPIGQFREVGAKVRRHCIGSFSVKLSHGYPLMEIGTAKHLSRALTYVRTVSENPYHRPAGKVRLRKRRRMCGHGVCRGGRTAKGIRGGMKLRPVLPSEASVYSRLRNGEHTYHWFYSARQFSETEVAASAY